MSDAQPTRSNKYGLCDKHFYFDYPAPDDECRICQLEAELEQVKQSRGIWRNNFIIIVECLDGANRRADAAEQRNVKLREALSHTLVDMEEPWMRWRRSWARS